MFTPLLKWPSGACSEPGPLAGPESKGLPQTIVYLGSQTQQWLPPELTVRGREGGRESFL